MLWKWENDVHNVKEIKIQFDMIEGAVDQKQVHLPVETNL